MNSNKFAAIVESMPNGFDGFLKQWGLQQFADAVELEVQRQSKEALSGLEHWDCEDFEGITQMAGGAFVRYADVVVALAPSEADADRKCVERGYANLCALPDALMPEKK